MTSPRSRETPRPTWNTDAVPPETRKAPTTRSMHGHDVVDDYEWLRAKDDPQVIEHLERENAYAESVTSGLGTLRSSIFGEIRSRTQETDLSVPNRLGDWWYFRRTVEGKNYASFCRVPALNTGDLRADWTPPEVPADAALDGEEVLLDCNELAEGLPFFALGSFHVTEDGRLLTYSVDDSGDERFDQYVKDLTTGSLLPDVVEGVFAGGFLTPKGSHLVYTLVDDSWRPYELRSHRLGTPVDQDLVLHHEEDVALWLGAETTADEKHLCIDVGCSEYNETRLLALADLEAAGPGRAPVSHVVIPREERVLYSAEPIELDGRPYVLLCHDHQAPNGELTAVDYDSALSGLSMDELRSTWTVVVPASSTRRLNGFHFNQTHLAASLREDGLEKAGFISLDAIRETLEGGDLPEPFEPFSGEELYTAKITAMALRSPVVGLGYISYVTPWRQYDYFPGLDELELRKQTPVLGGFRSEDYVAHREWAQAPDGTMIPLSVIHRADADLQTPHPVIQYGYGSYEASSNPGFSVSRLSLLDRGVVYVVAHVRGGGELGRDWYLQGKKLQKINTFTDFVAVTDHVATQPWADESRIAAYGGSAGGLLMGAIVNMAPEKYCGVLAAVPFVDPVTSISDPDLPLSALEWEEWGNPIEDKEVYEYMTSYAPYENVRSVAYPPIAAVTSLNDTRVLYVEPAKWVPKLREHTTGTAPILLRIEMDGGHGGGSGRYRQWEDTAWEYAFLLNCLGIDS
jgi:oligopeptidase B